MSLRCGLTYVLYFTALRLPLRYFLTYTNIFVMKNSHKGSKKCNTWSPTFDFFLFTDYWWSFQEQLCVFVQDRSRNNLDFFDHDLFRNNFNFFDLDLLRNNINFFDSDLFRNNFDFFDLDFSRKNFFETCTFFLNSKLKFDEFCQLSKNQKFHWGKKKSSLDSRFPLFLKQKQTQLWNIIVCRFCIWICCFEKNAHSLLSLFPLVLKENIPHFEIWLSLVFIHLGGK